MLSFIGLISGIVSGMGIGGGTILIPGLIIFTTLNQQQAQSVNLFTFIPIALVAVITHLKNKSVEVKIWLPLTITGVLGAIIGSKLAVNMSSELLRKMFGVFLFVMAIYQFFYKEKGPTNK